MNGKKKSKEEFNIFDAIEMIEAEKGIPAQYMLEKIANALILAYKGTVKREGANSNVLDNVFCDINMKKRELKLFIRKIVVEEVENPLTEVSLEEAQTKKKKVSIGGYVDYTIDTREFGRIAAQNAKQVIIQSMREAERGIVFEAFTNKEHEIITAQVSKVDPQDGRVVVEIGQGSDRTDAVLTPSEQVPGETFREGELIKIYIVEVRQTTKGPQILISRTHPGLIKRLFEIEVPEVKDGTVEIRSIAREAGSRTKIAVWSDDEDIDPIGACVGQKGGRVAAIVTELRGEKIDIVKYSDNPEQLIAAALAPSDVISVSANPEEMTCSVIVPSDQLSLAIGKEGQNARLAAKLTGYKIDIKGE